MECPQSPVGYKKGAEKPAKATMTWTRTWVRSEDALKVLVKNKPMDLDFDLPTTLRAEAVQYQGRTTSTYQH